MNNGWLYLIVPGLIIAWLFAEWLHERRAAHRAHVLALIAEAKRQERLYDPYSTQALIDQAEYIVRDQDQAMRIANSWPCDHEDGWCTGECLDPPRGRHHVVHTITDLPEPSDPRWRQ